MSTLKMTFSLASLILLFALVFSAMPLLAHLDSTESEHDEATTAANHDAHALLEAIDAPKYVNATDTFEVEFTFAAADEDNEVLAPTAATFVAANITLGSGDWTVTSVSMAGGEYKATIRPNNAVTTSPSAIGVTGDLALTPSGFTAVSVMLDSTAPTISDIEVKMPLDNGRRDPAPADDQWGAMGGSFDLIFTVSDDSDPDVDEIQGSGVDYGSGSLMFSADPDHLEFSDGGETDNGNYVITVTPKGDMDVAAGTEVEISITVSDKVGNEIDPPATHTIMLAAQTAADDDDDDMDDVDGLVGDDTRNTVTEVAEFELSEMIASNSFVVISESGAVEGIPSSVDQIAVENLPNLQRFFARGGTISLVGGASKSVVISEIMWGLNLTVEPAMQADWQWIELLNPDNDLTDTDADNDPSDDIDLSDYKLVFTPGTVLPKLDDLADQVSNIERLGWDVDIGQSGRLDPGEGVAAVDLVSMYRNINYTNLTKRHGDKNAADNKAEQLKAIPGGNSKGSWKESTVNDTYAINQLGSPGAQHFVGRSTTTATTASYAVVINEVGNNSGDSYDWLELRNTGTTEAVLQKWEITELTGHDAETALVSFPDNDKHKIPAGGILLIVNSDPYRNPNHPLAAGVKINHGQTREVKTGINSRYYVDSGLKLRDSGEMALLVRNANDKEKQPTNVVDFTGPRPFNNIEDLSSAYRTNQYPLRAQNAGGDDVFKDLDEKFAVGRVYHRHNAGQGNGNDTWRNAGPTGVGYKRGASGNGTPGYPNNVVHENETKLAGASAGAEVTISEIMYDRGERGNLPQWIELYNSSNTHAVNLKDWKLKIMNDSSDVDIRTPEVTIADLGETIILPNQTVLIVSYTTGRTSRGSQGGLDFPSDRIINLSDKGELEIDTATAGVSKRDYRLLSNTAFKITLMEKGGTAGSYVDMAGNKGADWELPMAEDGMGRSSIIRAYGAMRSNPRGAEGYDMAQDGTMRDGWTLAADSNLSEVRVNETYYGNPDDVGTPGYRGGGALPVSLSKFRPERLESGEIVVRWVTESELNNAGFNILRSETRNGEFAKINTSLIAGQGTTSERTAYEWKDTSAKPSVVYYYQIQDVSLDGKVQTLRQSRLKGDVSPAGKLTTTWGELKALQ